MGVVILAECPLLQVIYVYGQKLKYSLFVQVIGLWGNIGSFLYRETPHKKLRNIRFSTVHIKSANVIQAGQKLFIIVGIFQPKTNP